LVKRITAILKKLNNFQHNVKTQFCFENNKRIVFKQYLNAKDRFVFVKRINKKLQTEKAYTHIDLMTMRSSKDYCFKIKDYDKLIYVIVKPAGKKSTTSCHEFLTAALTLMGITELPIDEEAINDIYSSIEDIIRQNKIKNYSMDEVNLIEYDYTSLCQAASASRGILASIKEIPQIAYITGSNKWDDDICFLKCDNSSIKNYNSSDIIFKTSNSYHGISLKRKEANIYKDPPLINKSLLNLFNYDLNIKEILSTTISNYFINVLNEFYENKTITEHCNCNNWKKYISNIDIDIINARIKDDKCILWHNIRSVIFKNEKDICKDLLENILRIELLKLENFQFHIITGVGRYRKRKGFIVENPSCISLDSIKNVYNRYLSNTNISISRNKNREHLYRSTLFLTIYCGDIPIIDLEIRYKGKFHASPEILAFFTKEFIEMIHCSI